MRKLFLLVLAANLTIIGFSQNQLSFEVVSTLPLAGLRVWFGCYCGVTSTA